MSSSTHITRSHAHYCHELLTEFSSWCTHGFYLYYQRQNSYHHYSYFYKEGVGIGDKVDLIRVKLKMGNAKVVKKKKGGRRDAPPIFQQNAAATWSVWDKEEKRKKTVPFKICGSSFLTTQAPLKNVILIYTSHLHCLMKRWRWHVFLPSVAMFWNKYNGFQRFDTKRLLKRNCV